jgi:ribonuclease R
MILRTLTQASYSNLNVGHFGLWLRFYSHFTSPIRRYPDLQIHRIIKEVGSWKLKAKRIFHYQKLLSEVSKKCSEKERMAEKLEYKIKDYFICEYYKDKIWEKYFWVVSGMIPKWFFVELENTAEWFVEMKYWKFDDKLRTFFWKEWEKYVLWDSIEVELVEVDEELFRLNFEVVR